MPPLLTQRRGTSRDEKTNGKITFDKKVSGVPPLLTQRRGTSRDEQTNRKTTFEMSPGSGPRNANNFTTYNEFSAVPSPTNAEEGREPAREPAPLGATEAGAKP